jgi:hypothetical protein
LSGDTYTAAALLKLAPEINIILIKDTKGSGAYADKSGLILNKWQQQPDVTQQKIAEAWKVGKLPTELKLALYNYMATKFAKIGFDIRNNVLVLWNRQSGKRGGAHLEPDSSYEGIRQLALYFADEDPRPTVLLAGDERNRKLARIVDQKPYLYSTEKVEEQLSSKAAVHMSRPKFKKHFGESDEAARAFAKMDLLGVQGDYGTTDLNMIMNYLRGFQKSDFDKITRLVAGKMA